MFCNFEKIRVNSFLRRSYVPWTNFVDPSGLLEKIHFKHSVFILLNEVASIEHFFSAFETRRRNIYRIAFDHSYRNISSLRYLSLQAWINMLYNCKERFSVEYKGESSKHQKWRIVNRVELSDYIRRRDIRGFREQNCLITSRLTTGN